jgi:AcrR family transcriptional regulator
LKPSGAKLIEVFWFLFFTKERPSYSFIRQPDRHLQFKSSGLIRQGRLSAGGTYLLELDLAEQRLTKIDLPVGDTLNPGRLALIFAAEQSIAVHGVGGATLRQINEAAGHKNSGATHYHFGSRQGLIQAVLAYRVDGISARRSATFEDLSGQPEGLDIRGLVKVLAHPLVEELKPRAEGNYFLRFAERIRRERAQYEIIYDFPADEWRFAQTELVRRLAHLPPALAALRVQVAWDQIISGLASIEAKLQNKKWSNETFIAVETLVDFIAAGLTGPADPELLAALQQQPCGKDQAEKTRKPRTTKSLSVRNPSVAR